MQVNSPKSDQAVAAADSVPGGWGVPHHVINDVLHTVHILANPVSTDQRVGNIRTLHVDKPTKQKVERSRRKKHKSSMLKEVPLEPFVSCGPNAPCEGL